LQYTSECVAGDIELWLLDVEGNEEKKVSGEKEDFTGLGTNS
jgi:hypothetical protein